MRAAAVAALASAMACGGNGGPSGPTPSPGGGGGGGGTSGATITIGANGAVSPTQVTISVGQTVTFVNNHNTGHQISSNPHPNHTDCPSINALGTIGAGQTQQTSAFTAARTCGFHDHIEPQNPSLRGSIVIQ